MWAGSLDRRITIERKTVTQNDLGEEIETWATLATVWAQKIENRGAERFAAQQLNGKAVRTFRFRWSSDVKSITNEDRARFDGRTFDILDVREIGRREGIEIDCTAPGEEPLTNA